MRWVKLGTHIKDHDRFLAAGAIARDLYVWGLTYAGDHETDGELSMVAILASPWGAGGQKNARVAFTLADLGLWEKTETGYRILRWAEQGNQTKAQLSADREAARERKAKRGSGKVQANSGRTNTEVPTSTSLSPSGYGSGSEIASPPDVMPDWFNGSCDATAMALGGEVADRPARWLEYAGARGRKGWAMNHGDAVGWLSTVIRSERARATGRGGPVKNHVQSAEGRAWVMPKDMP